MPRGYALATSRFCPVCIYMCDTCCTILAPSVNVYSVYGNSAPCSRLLLFIKYILSCVCDTRSSWRRRTIFLAARRSYVFVYIVMLYISLCVCLISQSTIDILEITILELVLVVVLHTIQLIRFRTYNIQHYQIIYALYIYMIY